MAPAQLYDKDEKVLCFHHEMLYEAKVLDVRQEDKTDKKSGFQYLIHYKGWKNTWDDWVPQDRLRKFSEENLELAKNLKKEIDRVNQMSRNSTKPSIAKPRRGGGSARPSEERTTPAQVAGKKRVRDADTERTATMADELRKANLKRQWLARPSRSRSFIAPEAITARITNNNGAADAEAASVIDLAQPIHNAEPLDTTNKKRVRDADTERIDEWRDKPQIRLPFPDILKSILVDDWENVTWLNQMVPLPSQYPISELLDDYRQFQEPNVVPGSLNAAILDELTQGVREYFNLALGRILLYKQERRQFSEWRKRIMNKNDPIHKDGEKTLYQIYGAEHFLRLLTMMPELTAQTNLDAAAINRLREELINMLMWLAQKPTINKYFAVPYVDNHHLEEHERNGPHKHEPITAAAET